MSLILPCIDLMDGKVVQLVQGREKALEGAAPLEMLKRFAGFPEIQVIDLDAAMGRGSNDDAAMGRGANDAIVETLCAHARCRAGGGVRTVERARTLIAQGAHRVIAGTAAFTSSGINRPFLEDLSNAIGPKKIILALDSKSGKIVIRGWRESTDFAAEEIAGALTPYCRGFLCTYVDKEGMMQGTDLDWFRRLRASVPPTHEITAAGGITTLDDVRALRSMGVNAALGMAIYTGRIDLNELRALSSPIA